MKANKQQLSSKCQRNGKVLRNVPAELLESNGASPSKMTTDALEHCVAVRSLSAAENELFGVEEAFGDFEPHLSET